VRQHNKFTAELRETLGEFMIKPQFLATLAIMLNDKQDWNLKLEGHTDNVGDDAANLKLSEERETSVANYLISKGIAASRIEVYFYGETKPIATSDTEEGRKTNRRVEMNFVFK
jgi:OOP family OmpA-OmpF porin